MKSIRLSRYLHMLNKRDHRCDSTWEKEEIMKIRIDLIKNSFSRCSCNRSFMRNYWPNRISFLPPNDRATELAKIWWECEKKSFEWDILISPNTSNDQDAFLTDNWTDFQCDLVAFISIRTTSFDNEVNCWSDEFEWDEEDRTYLLLTCLTLIHNQNNDGLINCSCSTYSNEFLH